MFRRIEGLAPRPAVTLQVEGRAVQAFEGDTLAVALMNAGVQVFRQTPVSGAPRAPLCLMGACFDCLLQVDGRPNVQACMVGVRDGMRVQLQRGARDAGADQ
jgi:predicted molibdopterin-dependent oxidoreductase YjgC